MLLRRDAYIQGCFYTRVLLHRDAFHKGVLSHTDVDTHTDAFIRRCFYAQLHRCFYTGMLLHKGAFARRHAGASTHRCLYTSMRLHGAFTHMCFYTGSHSTQSTLYTEKLVHKYSYADFFSRKCIYTEAFLKHRQSTDTVTKRNFARISSHRDAFTHRRF